MPTPPGSLVKGTAVTIDGLKSRADLNACVGTVLSYGDGRYGVRVSGNSVRIKAENLSLQPCNPKPTMTDDVISTIQGATVPQLAWLVCEYGPSSVQIAELVLLYSCTLFSPENVGFPATWSRDGQQNVAAFLKSGGHLGVVSTMGAHIESEVVQERGVQQLMTLVVREVEQTLQSTDAVNAAGGAAAAVRAMRQHANAESLNTFCCRLLMNLSANEAHGEETAALNAAKRAVCEAGGIAAIAHAIDTFSTCGELLSPALNCVSNVLLGYPEAVEHALHADLPRRVVRVLGAVPSNAEVLAKGCMCLANLVCGAGEGARDASVQALVGAGAIPAICDAMRAHGHAPSAVESACAALHNLAGLGHAAACRDAGAVELVEAARRDWPTPMVEMLWDALQP